MLNATGDAGGRAAKLELHVEPVLSAFSIQLRVAETFGPMMAPIIRNEVTNLEKVTVAWRHLNRPATVRALLEAELASGIHRKGAVLKDPSAAMALLWMRRMLQFQTSMFDQLLVDTSGVLTAAARSAYASQLEPYHGWLLKNGFRVGLSGLPKRDEFLRRLAPNTPDPDRENICVEDMRDCVNVTNQVVEAMRALFVELDLEDKRKA